jgi:hypothetical protein
MNNSTKNISTRVLIDAGSSSLKVYKIYKDKIELSAVQSIPFKKNLMPETGLAPHDKHELLEFIKAVKNENPNTQIKIYATAVFRYLSHEHKVALVDEIFERTGLYFNIISHDMENFYLQNALSGKFHSNEPVLLVNIGGGSTELVVMYGKEPIEKVNIDLGVASILKEFCQINNEYSPYNLKQIVEHCIEKLPTLKNKPRIAFYTGGELKYMKLAEYNLKPNHIFKDELHPSLISLKDLERKNEEVFKYISLTDLKKLMPENPEWMNGARACSALAQAVFEKYNIDYIIPSDANLIDGVVRQEFKSVTLSGSFRKHLNYIVEIRAKLIKENVEVLSPRFTEPKNAGEEFVIFSGEEGLSPLNLERHHLESIEKSDALIVCDPQGYVGASALIEIGYAQALGKRIIFIEKPEEFMLNTLPSEIGL